VSLSRQTASDLKHRNRNNTVGQRSFFEAYDCCLFFRVSTTSTGYYSGDNNNNKGSVCDGVVVFVLAVVVDQRGRVLRGRGGRSPPVTSTVVVLVGPTGSVLV